MTPALESSVSDFSLEIVMPCRDWRVRLPRVMALARRVGAAAATQEPALNGSVALLLADDETLRDLNRRFRRRDRPTNVLSFPSTGSAPGFLGDVALALETCAREAEAQGKTLADHAAHLITHGLLHLAGYDHQNDREALVMEAKETAILASLGIKNPYMED